MTPRAGIFREDSRAGPFTQSSYVRAALYFLIPAGAWMVAVVIEAFLQAAVLGG